MMENLKVEMLVDQMVLKKAALMDKLMESMWVDLKAEQKDTAMVKK